MSYFGSCYCGEIHIEINGNIDSIIHCHCSRCRKASGTAYATNGVVNIDDFKILSGVKFIGKYSKITGKYRHFCTQCASPIYSSRDDNPKSIRLRLGILDSDIAERPMSHNFVTSKANWEDFDTDLPHFDTYEPGR